MLDKELLLDVGKTLWLDVYWTEEREGEYMDSCRKSGDTWVQELHSRPCSPDIPDVEDALIRLSHCAGRIEQAWGRTFFSIALEMYPTEYKHCYSPTSHSTIFGQRLKVLIYRTFMGCVGHGITPNDDGDFPEGLKPCPVDFENPMLQQLFLLD